MATDAIPAGVLEAWGFEEATLQPITVGLINRTYEVRTGSGERFVLQRLHDLFGPEVNLDLEAVTAHVARKEMPTPRLVRTREGAPFVRAEGTWRVLTFLHGRVLLRVETPAQAHAAGALLGRFLSAVSDLEHQFHFARAGVHDTPRHLGRLREALTTQRAHAEFAEVEPLAQELLGFAEGLPALPLGPSRVLHGDPKITNLLFHAERDEGLAMLDLDTLAHGQLAVEVGDALRSWCNPGGEDDASAAVSVPLARAALEGLAVPLGGALAPEELEGLVGGVETIALELAVRFCVDALEQTRWHHDPQRFSSRGAHNRARARSQLALARSLRGARGTLEGVVRGAFLRR